MQLRASDFAKVGLDFMGGCNHCHATLAAYNAYPSNEGYWLCRECIDDSGFETVADFEAWEQDAIRALEEDDEADAREMLAEMMAGRED
jgi:hypothetical protein